MINFLLWIPPACLGSKVPALPWLDSNELLNRPYLPADTAPPAAGAGEQMVFLRANASFRSS